MLNNLQINRKDIFKQLNGKDYDTFDDYLDLVLEHGHLILFAECFPLAPIIVLIVNSIELRSDMLKLSTVYKRPQFIRKRNIGNWHLMIQFLSILAIFTNLIITINFKEDSDNIDLYTSTIQQQMEQNYDCDSIHNFFVLEHLVLIIIVLIRLCFSSKSKWVSLYLKRRNHKLKENKWKALFNDRKSINSIFGEEKKD
jgi:hypothetical protein